jgi:hypothetical protein
MTALSGYPSYPDPYMADTLKQFRQALSTADVRTRINGLSEEQFVDVLYGVLKTVHGSSLNRGYARSVFYSCTGDLPPAASGSWPHVLGRCLGLISALNESESPRFWKVAGLAESAH